MTAFLILVISINCEFGNFVRILLRWWLLHLHGWLVHHPDLRQWYCFHPHLHTGTSRPIPKYVRHHVQQASTIRHNLRAGNYGGGFRTRIQTGSFKQDLNSVQIDISPDLNNILACEFFKYGRWDHQIYTPVIEVTI